MRKKIFIGLLGVVVVALLYGLVDHFILKAPSHPGEKTIYITFVDDINKETIIDKQAYKTKAETLGAFFDEGHEEFTVILDGGGELGRAIVGMIIDRQGFTSDFASATGPWIMFGSDNNESCVANGYCLGIDNFPIADGDRFVFEYSDASIFD